MSCRVAMLRMQEDGLIALPSAARRELRPPTHARRNSRPDPQVEISEPVDQLGRLEFFPVEYSTEADFAVVE